LIVICVTSLVFLDLGDTGSVMVSNETSVARTEEEPAS
jgi:hypothetical protein